MGTRNPQAGDGDGGTEKANGAQPGSKDGQNVGTPRKPIREHSVVRPTQDGELKDYVSSPGSELVVHCVGMC